MFCVPMPFVRDALLLPGQAKGKKEIKRLVQNISSKEGANIDICVAHITNQLFVCSFQNAAKILSFIFLNFNECVFLLNNIHSKYL